MPKDKKRLEHSEHSAWNLNLNIHNPVQESGSFMACPPKPTRLQEIPSTNEKFAC